MIKLYYLVFLIKFDVIQIYIVMHIFVFFEYIAYFVELLNRWGFFESVVYFKKKKKKI